MQKEIFIVIREDWEGTRKIESVHATRKGAETAIEKIRDAYYEYFVDKWLVEE